LSGGRLAVQDSDFGGVVDWELSNEYAIFPRWRHRYPPSTTHNTEHVFALQVPEPTAVRLAPEEHLSHLWLPWAEAAPKCFSWSNRQAIEELPRRVTERGH
jgi:dATP pyrophosphohydrolase